MCFCLGRVQDVFCHVVYVREIPLKNKKSLSLYTVDAIDYLSEGVNEMKQKKMFFWKAGAIKCVLFLLHLIHAVFTRRKVGLTLENTLYLF